MGAGGERAEGGELERPGVLFETATAAGRRACPLGAEPGVRYASELGEGNVSGEASWGTEQGAGAGVRAEMRRCVRAPARAWSVCSRTAVRGCGWASPGGAWGALVRPRARATLLALEHFARKFAGTRAAHPGER